MCFSVELTPFLTTITVMLNEPGMLKDIKRSDLPQCVYRSKTVNNLLLLN